MLLNRTLENGKFCVLVYFTTMKKGNDGNEGDQKFQEVSPSPTFPSQGLSLSMLRMGCTGQTVCPSHHVPRVRVSVCVCGVLRLMGGQISEKMVLARLPKSEEGVEISEG